MAEIVGSLFGVTPEDYQQARQAQADKMALDFAKLDPFESARFAIGRGAYGLAGALGGALGAQDPELQLISARNAIAKQIDMSNPDSIMMGMKELQRLGDVQGQLQLMQIADVSLKRADEQRRRAQTIEAEKQAALAQKIARGAYVPGKEVKENLGESTVGTEALGLPKVVGTTQPTYDVSRVAPQLQLLGAAGRAELTGIYKVAEEAAKVDKAQAEAILKQAQAQFAPESELAKLRQNVAEADYKVAQARKEEAYAQNAPERAKAETDKAVAEAFQEKVKADFAERMAKIGFDKTTWEVKNLQSQISDRAKKLGIDQMVANATVAEKMAQLQKILTDLPTDARKLINESATAAATSRQAATQFADLATRIQAAEGGKGAFTTASEWLARATGRQDEWTQIRSEYTRLRNTVAIKALPPGPATDKDIALALKGIPPENANAEILSSFLRGLAKMQEVESSVANAKTDWLAQNNGLLTRVDKAIRVGDYVARPGESFEELSTRIAKDVNSRLTGTSEDARRAALIGQIPAGSPSTNLPATQAATLNRADSIIRGGK